MILRKDINMHQEIPLSKQLWFSSFFSFDKKTKQKNLADLILHPPSQASHDPPNPLGCASERLLNLFNRAMMSNAPENY